MSSMSGPQRSSQRRPPTADLPIPPGQQSGVPANHAPRTSSGSAKSQSNRSTSQQDKQISQIEKSVTHLLVATKQLLETLTQWSRRQATEGEVSDVYVRLGYEFNLACRAFSSIGVETADLGPVPDLLRAILEDTLSQDASPQSLDQYLPKIRDIIINLLQGLKRKQAKLRSRSSRETRQGSSGSLDKQASAVINGETGLSQVTEQIPAQEPRRHIDGRSESITVLEDPDINKRASHSVTNEHTMPSDRDISRRESRILVPSTSSSSLSSGTLQSMPVASPYADTEGSNIPVGFPPPPPPPKQQDALAALQRGGDLERRASRRFSTFQISKHLGASPNGMTLPPTQNSPVPNRGRDMRESMNAVRSRGSFRHSRQRSNTRMGEASPSRPVQAPGTIAEEKLDTRAAPRISPPDEPLAEDSPTTKTPEDKYRVPLDRLDGDVPAMGATVNGPLPPLPEPPSATQVTELDPIKERPRLDASNSEDLASSSQLEEVLRRTETPPARHFTPESSPPPSKELTLFLQYKSRIKKFVLPEGYDGLTIARLQLAFIEKFAWNTHNNGADLPEIYIQDPISGVRHELEDLNDVKDRAVLVLNVEILDEVKKHFDDGIGDIRHLLEGVRGAVDGQEALMQRFAERQLETAKDMARIAVAPPTPKISKTTEAPSGVRSSAASEATLSEVQSLRREIAVLRQSYTSMASDFSASMQSIRSKGDSVAKLAANAAVPSVAGNAGRLHVENGKKQLLDDSENLVNRVDDLSDLVEDLRKDVVTRGVRPLPRQLEDVSKDISVTVKELTKVKDFLVREKTIWTKVWEKELNTVCQERDELSQQEDLMADLAGDLEDLSKVFQLVEEATKQQNIHTSDNAAGVRTVSRNLPIDPYVDPQRAKDGVLGEVRALQPNHEDRLEAIERAERARQRELESRKGGEFQREVEQFVEEGKLKKTGGAEEVERRRRLKDEQALKENWDRLAARKADQEERERQEALVAAQQQPLPESSSGELNGSIVQESMEEDAANEAADKFEEAQEEPVAEGQEPAEVSPSTPGKRSSSWLPSIFTSSGT